MPFVLSERLHLFLHFRELLEKLEDYSFGQDQQCCICPRHCCGISAIQLPINQHIMIPKIRALNVQRMRLKFRFQIALDRYIPIEFDPPFVKKEYLRSLVTLIVKSVLLRDPDLSQHRDYLPNELLVFVFEEFKFHDDVLVSERNNPRFVHRWQVIDKFVVIYFL